MDYHRRIGELKNDKVPTLCGQVVNYQEACSSLTNVGCPMCIAAADRVVDHFVGELRELLGPGLAKLAGLPPS